MPYGNTSVSALAQAPSHWLNQCWFLLSRVQCHSPESYFTTNAQATVRYSDLEIILWKLLLHLSSANNLWHWLDAETHPNLCIFNRTKMQSTIRFLKIQIFSPGLKGFIQNATSPGVPSYLLTCSGTNWWHFEVCFETTFPQKTTLCNGDLSMLNNFMHWYHFTKCSMLQKYNLFS